MPRIHGRGPPSPCGDQSESGQAFSVSRCRRESALVAERWHFRRVCRKLQEHCDQSRVAIVRSPSLILRQKNKNNAAEAIADTGARRCQTASSCRTCRAWGSVRRRDTRAYRRSSMRRWRARRRWSVPAAGGSGRTTGKPEYPRRRSGGPVSRTWFRNRHKGIRRSAWRKESLFQYYIE